MKYFSMFSGVGGFELGIGKLGECVGYSEIDKYAIITYEGHFDHENYGDARTINPDELPDFDLLVGGFPCQAFSIAGKRGGFSDTRGTLFFDIARILTNKRPRHLVLENVKGLLSHDSGKTFQTILGVLADLGYRVEWQILNGKRYVPQNRERVIIVGHFGDECSGAVFPFTAENKDDTRRLGQSVSRSLDANYYKGVSPKGYQGSKRQLVASGQGLPNRWDKSDNPNTKPTFTLNTQDVHGVYDGIRIRRLTPLECERLMGWPDNWTEGVSDTQRYKQCGNGIIAPMVTEIMLAMKPCLGIRLQ